MGRRRLLRVVSSSDDEDDYSQPPNQNHSQPPHQTVTSVQQSDEEDEVEVQFQEPLPDIETVALNSSSVPIQPHIISDDDDFIEVSDQFTPPSPHQPSPTETNPPETAIPICPVLGLLRSLGLNLRTEWFESCMRGLETAVPGFSGLVSETKAKFCFQQFLNSDLNFTGAGVLPPNVDSMHLVELAGPFVLQVDEIVNISSALRQRYQNVPAGPKRCLKLSMTDGIQRVFGMEYRPIKELQPLAMAGFKVAIKNVIVRHGLLMLVPETLEILGGSVQELEAARQRLVNEVNKPPRGKRTRHGVLPPLATRATLAAWPQNGPNNPVETNTSAQNKDTSIPQDVQGSGINIPRTSGNSVVAPASRNAGHGPSGAGINPPRTTRDSVVAPASRDAGHGPSGAGINPPRTTRDSVVAPASRDADRAPSGDGINPPRTTQDSAVAPVSRDDAPSAAGYNTLRMTGDSVDASASRETDELPIDMDTSDHPCTRESTVFSTSARANEDNLGSATVRDVEDVNMADAMDYPFLLSGDREVPFTYLTSLLAKWDCLKGKASRVQGKIKCFVTAVTGFQFRDRSTYELNVYVEDGSFISEVHVHHNVVQELIGHSPQEVTATLSLPDKVKVNDMKKKAANLQNFLADFEGVMLLELNESSDLPIVIEMTQGCSSSDAWSLLKRSLSSDTPSANVHLDPIVLSP